MFIVGCSVFNLLTPLGVTCGKADNRKLKPKAKHATPLGHTCQAKKSIKLEDKRSV